MLMKYPTSLYAVIGVHVLTAQDFLKKQSKLVFKVLTIQWIQHDQIFILKTKGSTFETEQNNILISPISNLEIFKIGKLSLIGSLTTYC